VLAVLLLFGTPIFWLPSKVEGWEWYNKTSGSEWYLENVRPVTDKWLGGTLRLFVRDVFEKSGYRTNERTMLYVNARMPVGHTLEQMDAAMQQIESYLQGVQGVEQFITQVISGQQARISIHFTPEVENGSLPYQLRARLISRSVDLGGVEWNIYGVGQGFSNGRNSEIASFRVEMRGHNFRELQRQAEILADKLLAHKRIQEVDTDELRGWGDRRGREFRLTLQRERLALSNLPPARVTAALRQQGMASAASMYLSLGAETLPVSVESNQATRFDLFALRNRPIGTAQEKPFKTGDFAAVQLVEPIQPQSPSAEFQDNSTTPIATIRPQPLAAKVATPVSSSSVQSTDVINNAERIQPVARLDVNLPKEMAPKPQPMLQQNSLVAVTETPIENTPTVTIIYKSGGGEVKEENTNMNPLAKAANFLASIKEKGVGFSELRSVKSEIISKAFSGNREPMPAE